MEASFRWSRLPASALSGAVQQRRRSRRCAETVRLAAAGVLGSQRRRLSETRSSYLPPCCAAAPVAAADPASPAEQRGARCVSFARRCAKSWAGGGKNEPCFAARRSSWRFSLRAAWYASSCAFLSSALARCRARHACVLRSWRARRSSSSACDMPAVALGFFTAAAGATRHVLRGRRMLLPCAAGREEALGDWEQMATVAYDVQRGLPSSLSAAVLPRLTPSLRAQPSACKQQLRVRRAAPKARNHSREAWTCVCC